MEPALTGMKSRGIAALALLLGTMTAWALTPKEEWKKEIAELNRHYAQVPHAMLQIQDAVYLGEGEAAALQGRPDQPASWRWTKNSAASAIIRVSLKNQKLTITRNEKAVDSSAIQSGLSLGKDVDVVGQPTQVGAGVPGWRIFVYNQNNPAARSFTGVAYFPYDPAYRVTAQFTPDPNLRPRVFRTSRGTDKQFYHAGDAIFLLQGRKITLPFYAESNRPGEIADMSAFYTDGLTGKGAYGSGRYVDVGQFGRFPPARITIDLNFAYNPNCARSPYFTCPLATDDIPVPVAAGERDPHASH